MLGLVAQGARLKHWLTMGLGPQPDAAAYMVPSMAQYRLKHPDEARAALTKGTDNLNPKLLPRDNDPLDDNWEDWLVAHILPREAQALIQGQINSPAE